MVNKARTTYFDIPSTTFGTVQNITISGLIKLAARENAPNPRYIALISDIGELLLFDKDGSLLYGPVGPFSGHGSPDELSINVNREVCIRSSTSLAVINNDGTLRWNKTGASLITNLEGAKIGQNYVACLILTLTAATSGVQWRSLVDGSIVQNVYGTLRDQFNTSPRGAIAVSQTGDRAAITYVQSGSPYYYNVEQHHRTSGRLWNWLSPLNGAAGVYTAKLAVDKDGGYTILVGKSLAEGTASSTNECRIFDSTGALLGTPWSSVANLTYLGCCMAPDGKQAGAYHDTTLDRIIIVPYTYATTALAARGHGIDITDDDLYYTVGCENGTLYVFRVDGFAMGNTPYGGVSTPIAVVRNYT